MGWRNQGKKEIEHFTTIWYFMDQFEIQANQIYFPFNASLNTTQFQKFYTWIY